MRVALEAASEGVTLLGGEPFEQAPALAALAEQAQQQGLSVMVFTGFTLEHLQSLARDGVSGVGRLLGKSDLLVDGPYRADLLDRRRPWVGSTNQRFHFLTPRYAHIASDLAALPDRIELTIAADGEVSVNGWADDETLDALLDGLGVRQQGLNSTKD